MFKTNIFATPLFLIVLTAFLPTSTIAKSLLIKNITLISTNIETTQKVGNVLIENNQITAIGKTGVNADEIYDGTNQYLIPGLIDSHVHLEGIPGYTFDKENHNNIEEDSQYQIPRSYLYHGFTTLLDLAANIDLIKQWRNTKLAPDAYYCSPVFIPNGYPLSFRKVEEQFTEHTTPYMLFDQQYANSYPQNFDKNAHTPERLVNTIKANGSQCIKVYYETGFGEQKNLPLPTLTAVKALVKIAHSNNMQVYLHGNSQQSYEFAIEANVDMIVHGMWHWSSSLSLTNNKNMDIFVNEFSQRKIAVQPTIQVLYGEQELFNPNYLTHESIKHVMPESLISWYQSEEGQWMKKRLRKIFEMPDSLNNQNSYQLAKSSYQAILKKLNTITNKFSKAKVPLIFGSDTPSGPLYTQFPGTNGREEMNRWLEAGISLKQLFNALTIENATMLGLEDEIGSIEIGKKANLLILENNPLEDIKAYDDIIYVIKNGHKISRYTLSAKNIN